MLRSIYRVGTVLFSFALALVFVMAGSELHAQAAEPATQVKQVSTSTEPTAGGYVLSYSDNEATRSATATLKIGTKYTLALRSPDVLVIKDGQDKTIESLASYKQQLEQRYPEVAVGAWILATDHEATITISQKPTATGLYGEEKISAPSKAWYNCMANHGIEGGIGRCCGRMWRVSRNWLHRRRSPRAVCSVRLAESLQECGTAEASGELQS